MTCRTQDPQPQKPAGVAPLPDLLWDEGEQLVGESLRIAKIAFVELPVYRLAIYVDAPAAAEALAAFAGQPYDTLSSQQDFFDCFVNGRFRKTMHFTFLRKLPKARLQTTFHSALLSRGGPGSAAEVENFTAFMDSTAEGDVLTVRFQADGEHLEVNASWRASGSCAFKSPAVWLCTQQAYFDKDAEHQAIKLNALRHLPEIVFGNGHLQERCDSTSSSNASNEGLALAEAPTGCVQSTLRSRKTWRDFAGRSNGKDGYKFGDITRGVLAKSKASNKSRRLADESIQADSSLDAYRTEISELRREYEDLDRRSGLARHAALAQRWSFFGAGVAAGVGVTLLVVVVSDGLFAMKLSVPCGTILVFLCMICSIMTVVAAVHRSDVCWN